MRTPLVVVTGVDPVAMDTTLMSLSWDLPRAVAVRHRIDPHSQVLTRTVSDSRGVLEHEQIQLEHACVSCALREDIVPTLERLSQDGRWSSIVAGLPTATEAVQLSRVLATQGRLARRIRLSSVVSAASAGTLAQDLLGSDLLRDRDLHTNPGDDRGVGEVACAQIEFADVVVFDDAPGAEGADLVRALSRPESTHVVGADHIDGTEITAHRHGHLRSTSWCSPEIDDELPPLGKSHAWRLDLSSPRPFHPERLLEQIDRLGGGPHRSRGRFWLPTRPGAVHEWAGAGGQLSIGGYRMWNRSAPATRLIFTGLGTVPHALVEAFEDLLLSPAEARADRSAWAVGEDGFEPWLGEIRDVA